MISGQNFWKWIKMCPRIHQFGAPIYTPPFDLPKCGNLGPQEMVILGLNVPHCRIGHPGNVTKVLKYL